MDAADLDPALQRVVAAFADRDRFVGATMTGARRHAVPPAIRISIRPVELREGPRIQFSAFDGRNTAVTNIDHESATEQFAGLIQSGFKSVMVKTTDGDHQLTFSKKGKPMVVRHRATDREVDTSHDRSKQHLVNDDAPFLRHVGIVDGDGRIKPTARAKFRQVERFVEIVSHTLPDDSALPPDSEIRVIDYGCGAGVLTFATFHYLAMVRGLRVTMIGLDTKRDIIDELNRSTADLGWDGLRFEVGTIADHPNDPPADMVIALHACDTATDDALAQAIHGSSAYILAAPCCQHDLQAQLDGSATPPSFSPMLRHGIIRERFGDLLTDSLRAELLRAHGYRADVIEFVSTEHTGKNLMIRAVRTGEPDEQATRAAAALAAEWGVEPALAKRLDGFG